jgi:hypothetical protein
VTGRYNKAGFPTTKAIAFTIEKLRDLLFRQYGADYRFAVMGKGQMLAASHDHAVIHSVVSGKESKP